MHINQDEEADMVMEKHPKENRQNQTNQSSTSANSGSVSPVKQCSWYIC